jgi:TetR/AcrR family transcriptional regulator of autoinduction and epiphytic fitness
MDMMAAARAQSAGLEIDPRVERSRRVILEAVLGELGEVGYGAFSIEGVAARAGVGKSTIYRHWDGKFELVVDAYQTLKAQATVPEEGTVRERVTVYLQQVAALVADSTYSACMPALIDAAARDPRMKEFHSRFSAERRAVLVDLLQSGVESGELPATADPDLLADALVGPIVLRRLMMGAPCDPTLVPNLVAQVLPPAPATTSRKR